MHCGHCKQRLTEDTDSFGDSGGTYCETCFFHLLDMRIDLREALKDIEAMRKHNAHPGPDASVDYQCSAEQIARVEADVEILKRAIETFNRYGVEKL